MTQYGDIRPSYAAKVISGLEGNFVRKQQPGSGERFVAVSGVQGPQPRGFSKGGLGRNGRNAVYRIKGNNISTVFNLFSQRTNLKPVLTTKSL